MSTFINTAMPQRATSVPGGGGGLNITLPPAATTGQPPQWHFDATKMSWAHNSIANGGLGIVDLWNEMGVRGEGVNVAVIDTGITSARQDFANVQDTRFRASGAITNATDVNGHGTNSAAILAATGVNTVFGVAPAANLYIYRFEAGMLGIPISDLTSAVSDIVSGKQWPVDIISISFCFPQDDPRLNGLLSSVKDKTIILSALDHQQQTGNPVDDNQSPAHYDFVIPVAASKTDMQTLLPCKLVSSLNNQFNWVFPGENITTLDKAGNKITNGMQSSIATPFAAGVFALFLSYMKARGITINAENINKLKQLLLDYSVKPGGVNTVFCRPYSSFQNFNHYF